MHHMNTSRPVLSLLLLALLAAACGPASEPMKVRFKPEVRGQPLSCTATYSDIGRTATTLQLLDFKLYVHDVALVRANGERHPLALEEDGQWQRGSLALLDFEDATGTCDTGSPEVRTELVGSAPHHEDYTGLEFKLGVPEALNHLDAATQPAPLNIPGMWWSWRGGYKYLRLDVRSRGNAAFFLHLGASGCTGSAPGEYSCSTYNQALISLSGFNPQRNEIVLDLASLYASSDLDAAVDNRTDFVSGCMSSASDPQCPPLLAPLGLTTTGEAPPSPPSFFTVR